jgi:hypothetical protein
MGFERWAALPPDERAALTNTYFQLGEETLEDRYEAQRDAYLAQHPNAQFEYDPQVGSGFTYAQDNFSLFAVSLGLQNYGANPLAIDGVAASLFERVTHTLFGTTNGALAVGTKRVQTSRRMRCMARFARIVAPHTPHHVTQRGNRRQQTFFHDGDYVRYLQLAAEWCAKADAECWGYCLMPNHVHLILTPKTADGLRAALAPLHIGAIRRK